MEDVTLLYDNDWDCSGHQKIEPGNADFICGFVADDGVKQIDVYYTHDYAHPAETDVTETVVRNGDTGEPCSNGDGQVNFTVVLYPGYEISGVSATAGTYKNIKGPDDTGLANTYRITKISGDTTVTVTTEKTAAPPAPANYSIVFDANGGTGTTKSQTGLVLGKTYTLTANKFTRTGYHFVEWNTEPDGSGESYANKKKVSDLSLDGSVVTLYAQWAPNEYTVTYNGNGGKYTPEGSTKTASTYTQKLTYDAEESLEGVRFVRPGYTFVEWNTKKNGSGVFYEDMETAQHNLTNKNNGKVTLYAIWQAHEYTVIFDANEAAGVTAVDGDTASVAMKYDVSKALTVNGYTRQGYRFTGWNTEADGSGKTYKNKAKVKNLTTEDGAEFVLYAQWAVNTYNVKFNMNKGTAPDKTTFAQMSGLSVEGTPRTIPDSAAPTRKGYVFNGWNTKANGSGEHYDPGDELNFDAQKNKQTFTLYAEWVAE